MPSYIDAVPEGYNAKLPDDDSAYKAIDARLKEMGYAKRQMPTSLPQERRFMYWKDSARIIVTVYYAGYEIYVEIPGTRTSAKLNSGTLGDFTRDYIEPLTNGKSK